MQFTKLFWCYAVCITLWSLHFENLFHRPSNPHNTVFGQQVQFSSPVQNSSGFGMTNFPSTSVVAVGGAFLSYYISVCQNNIFLVYFTREVFLKRRNHLLQRRKNKCCKYNPTNTIKYNTRKEIINSLSSWFEDISHCQLVNQFVELPLWITFS